MFSIYIKECYMLQSSGGLCVEGEVRSGGGSVRIHHLTGVSPEGRSRFPKLEECAHFHYEHVELGPIQVTTYYLWFISTFHWKIIWFNTPGVLLSPFNRWVNYCKPLTLSEQRGITFFLRRVELSSMLFSRIH